jgi:hypothetical protein
LLIFKNCQDMKKENKKVWEKPRVHTLRIHSNTLGANKNEPESNPQSNNGLTAGTS